MFRPWILACRTGGKYSANRRNGQIDHCDGSHETKETGKSPKEYVMEEEKKVVKKTKFDHHPIAIVKGLFLGNAENYIGGVILDLKAAAIASASGTDDVSWTTMDLEDIAGVTCRLQ